MDASGTGTHARYMIARRTGRLMTLQKVFIAAASSSANLMLKSRE